MIYVIGIRLSTGQANRSYLKVLRSQILCMSRSAGAILKRSLADTRYGNCPTAQLWNSISFEGIHAQSSVLHGLIVEYSFALYTCRDKRDVVSRTRVTVLRRAYIPFAFVIKSFGCRILICQWTEATINEFMPVPMYLFVLGPRSLITDCWCSRYSSFPAKSFFPICSAFR